MKKIFFSLLFFFVSFFSIAQVDTFYYTGSSQNFVVPPGVISVSIECWGAQGGDGDQSIIINSLPFYPLGGEGGFASGDLAVSPGDVLEVNVGGQGSISGYGGFNGGGLGAQYGTGGGGASDVRTGTYQLNERVIVAGGGGGSSIGSFPNKGGSGGGLIGNNGIGYAGTGGSGGSQTSGGSSGCCYGTSSDGSFGIGGGIGSHHNAGGGGGYYGGGSGAAHSSAGGGSSYIGGVLNGSTSSGVRLGNGLVIISYLNCASPITANCVPLSSSTATSAGYGGIMNFSIPNIYSNPSGNTQTDGGYIDFSTDCNKIIYLNHGTSYNFELTTWYNAHDYKGYIDFNNDGDFLDPNEEVFSGANPSNLNWANGTNTSTGNGTLTIPITNGTNILANTPLRLRIISELSSATVNIYHACHNPFYAQAEDYQLIINNPTTNCIPPSNLTVSNISSNSAQINWIAGSNNISWDIEYGVSGFAQGTGSFITTNTNPYIISGLTELTSYDVYVRSNCIFGNSSLLSIWLGPINFSTPSNCNISVSAGADQTVCEGDNFQLSASFLQGASYSWSPTTGLSNPFVRSPNSSLNSTTTYTVTCSLNGCTNTDSVIITVNPLPNVDAGFDQTICLGSFANLSGNYIQFMSYNWRPVTFLSSPNSNFTTASPTSSITYYLDGTLNGCTNTDSVSIIVNPLPNVIAGSDQTVCLGDDVTLSASGANSYSWTNGVVNNVAFIPTSPNPNFVSSVSYTVTGTDNNGCSNTDIVLVTINPLPDIYASSFINGLNTTSSEVYLCLGDSLRLYGSNLAFPLSTYDWDNGVMDNEWFTPTSSNIYTLTGNNDITGCSNTDQITLTVNELPAIVETIINEEYGDDGSISIEVIAGTPPFDFDWDVDGLGDNDDFQDLTDLRGGTYVLIVTDDNSCQTRFTIVLENMTSLVIPSAITPNGDGVNDLWDIKGLHGYPEMQLQIFDRNGILLHEQQGLYTDWDGIYAGKQLQEGDYFYIIDLKNGERPYMGAVSIKF